MNRCPYTGSTEADHSFNVLPRTKPRDPHGRLGPRHTPDADGRWVRPVMQDKSLVNSSLPIAVTGPAGLKATLARFTGPPAARGTVDLNCAYQGGSVARVLKVGYRAGAGDNPK